MRCASVRVRACVWKFFGLGKNANGSGIKNNSEFVFSALNMAQLTNNKKYKQKKTNNRNTHKINADSGSGACMP